MSDLIDSDKPAKRKRGNPNMVKGGPSLNPKGRPRSGMAFAERVRERIDPDMLIDAALRALECAEKTTEILAAAEFLRGSGYCKPPTASALQITDARDSAPTAQWDKISLDERKALLRRLRGDSDEDA